ncbi:C40 family peptidase [Gemmatimonas phototrophica]|uniref:C40 family peptidase n=1 Tax=Gemmatimonas phototrophica TaxID=1379270 RepID=UPI000479797D|nr:SH3 domain-containing C40 family peptidase [Gemmatimonas phototrophica]
MTSLTLSTADRFTVRSAIAPLLGEARISASLTSQLLGGEVVHLVDGRGDWLRVRGADEYEGWTHVGYLMPCNGTEGTWRISLGCVTRDAHGTTRRWPLGARLAPTHEVLDGDAIALEARASRFPRAVQAIADSAATLFTGASYQWGGVTPWGVDCSGLVQRVLALHGVPLPRDAWQQAEATTPVHDDAAALHAPGDLLFFSDRDDRRITHVGISLGERRMVHSALTRGGVAIEQMDQDEPYVARLRAQCTGVHRIGG